MSPRVLPLLVLVPAIVLAGCTGSSPGAVDDPLSQQAVSGGAGGGGGVVANSPPRVTAFLADRTSGPNDGSLAVVFSGTAFDSNTENQIRTIEVAAAGPVALASNHTVTAAERLAADEPASFGADGWKVWTSTARDGALLWKYRQAFPAFTPAGAYPFRATVTDAPGTTGASSVVTVTLTAFSLIDVSSAPVDLAGNPAAGSWGGWTAEAGATNVLATNYLKITNNGDAAAAAVVIDFTETAFVGVEDANFSVPIDGNMQFAWFEDVTPAASAPSEKPFAFGAASPNGAVTLTFTGKGNVIYVAYRLAQLPAVLPAQAYSAAFTATEL